MKSVPEVRQTDIDVGLTSEADDVSVPDRTAALCRGLELILLHHGCRHVVRREMLEQIRDYLDTSPSEKVWLKRSKYLLSFPNAKYTRNDPPPLPDLPFKFKGAPNRWFKNRLIAFNRKNSHFFFSWFQGKRSSLPASESFVSETYDTHLATLTKEDKGDEYAISACFSDPTFVRVLKKVRGDIDTQLSECVIDHTMSASSSACFEQTRKIGGQLAELQRKVSLRYPVPKPRRPDHDIVLRPECLDSCFTDQSPCSECKKFMKWQKQVSKMLGVQEFRNVLSLTTDLYRMVEIPQLYSKKKEFNVVKEIRCPYGYELWDDVKVLSRELELKEALSCTIQAVLEPFKVRVISKGNALPYYSCRPLQQILWKSLSEIPCFRLIGRPLSPTDILDLKENAKKDWEWFSIDYSAATDGISWRYTSRILRFLLANQEPRVLEMALRVLGPHKLYYPEDGDGAPVFRGMQTNGQLMGSILSFPILCLANLGTYLVTMRLEQEAWSYKDIINHVLVNGDDMVYAAPRNLWERHIKVARDVGLEMSIGKAYHHRTYLNINSTAVHCGIHLDGDLPCEIPYLNTGLFFGLHKVQGRSDCEDHHSGDKGLFVNANTLMRGALPGKESDVLKQYIHLHKDEMLEKSKMMLVYPGKRGYKVHYRNWFLPISSGGMGIVPPKGWKFYTRPIDRVICKNLINKDSCATTTQYPLPGYECERLETEASVPWHKPRQVEDLEEDVPRLLIKMESRSLKKRCWLPILHWSPFRTALRG